MQRYKIKLIHHKSLKEFLQPLRLKHRKKNKQHNVKDNNGKYPAPHEENYKKYRPRPFCKI